MSVAIEGRRRPVDGPVVARSFLRVDYERIPPLPRRVCRHSSSRPHQQLEVGGKLTPCTPRVHPGERNSAVSTHHMRLMRPYSSRILHRSGSQSVSGSYCMHSRFCIHGLFCVHGLSERITHASNLYPKPRTVVSRRGSDGFCSTFARRRLTWTSRVFVSPT